MSKTNIPGDWIAPDEFTFCRCGYRLILSHEMLCGVCRCRGRLGTDWKDAAIRQAEASAAQTIHDSLSESRMRLCINRIARGFPPRFWMRPKRSSAESRVLPRR